MATVIYLNIQTKRFFRKGASDYRVERRLFDGADVSLPIRLFPPPVESAIAISINLGTGCKGRREIVFPCKNVRERGRKGRTEEGTRYSGLVARVSQRGIIPRGSGEN